MGSPSKNFPHCSIKDEGIQIFICRLCERENEDVPIMGTNEFMVSH